MLILVMYFPIVGFTQCYFSSSNASFSGMGVALSILGNNTSSLVGVAISASLLPPAVNAGICWAHAILIRAKVVENTSGEDFARIAGISFALTVVNIVCIWVFGMLMFKIKVRYSSVCFSSLFLRLLCAN